MEIKLNKMVEQVNAGNISAGELQRIIQQKN